MGRTLATIQTYRLLSQIDDGYGLDSRSTYLFRTDMIAELLSSWAGTRRFGLMVDIGCANGSLTRRLARLADKVIAVDSNAASLAQVQHPRITTVQDTLPNLTSLEPGKADLIVCFDTLYYLDDGDLEAAVAAFHRLLRPGGRLIINNAGTMTGQLRALGKHFARETVIYSPVSPKDGHDPDRLFWLLEYRIRLCKAVWKAMTEQGPRAKHELAPLMHHACIRFSVKYPFAERFIWVLLPFRWFARVFWANRWYFRRFCLEQRPSAALWVYEKMVPEPSPQQPSG